jgi:hypothetical protein
VQERGRLAWSANGRHAHLRGVNGVTTIGRAQISCVSAELKATMTQKVYVLLLLNVLAGGCAESHTERARRLEPMLAQAGFRTVPANTPTRSQKLGEMTPLRISHVSRNGKLSYWFADPYVCHCLYVGNEQNFDQFEQLKEAKQEEQSQEVTDMAEQTKYEQFMNSPAGGVFYGE